MGPQRMFGMTPWVRRLMVANLVVFLLQNTVVLSLPLVFGFIPLQAFARPWTFLTYMFVHQGVLHLAFNMLALYVFGPPVEERLGGRAFIGYYVLCGLGGAALSFLLMQVVPVHLVVGASGAVLGLAFAFAWHWPNEPIFVFPLPEPIPAKWLVTFAIAIDLILAWVGARSGTSDGVAHLAHLGGIGTGFAWLKIRDWRLGQAERQLRAVGAPGVLVHPAAQAARGSDPAIKPRRPAPDRTQAEINRVLDKISARGIGSLTPAERRFLAEMSKKMRDRH
jgi:membrane associated rhomboid family serine protease